MEQSSKEKRVFITLYGKYQFVTMPFGLVAAPSTFKRLIDKDCRDCIILRWHIWMIF